MTTSLKIALLVVETFNACTSRPDVCQCLVVQTTMDDMSKISAKNINDTRNLQIKASFSFEVVHAMKTGLQSGMQLCITPGLPTQLVQELNVRTVSSPRFRGHWLQQVTGLVRSVGHDNQP